MTKIHTLKRRRKESDFGVRHFADGNAPVNHQPVAHERQYTRNRKSDVVSQATLLPPSPRIRAVHNCGFYSTSSRHKNYCSKRNLRRVTRHGAEYRRKSTGADSSCSLLRGRRSSVRLSADHRVKIKVGDKVLPRRKRERNPMLAQRTRKDGAPVFYLLTRDIYLLARDIYRLHELAISISR